MYTTIKVRAFASLIIIKFRRSKFKNETFTQIHSFFLRVSLPQLMSLLTVIPFCIFVQYIRVFVYIWTFSHPFFSGNFFRVLPLCHSNISFMITLTTEFFFSINLEYYFSFVSNCTAYIFSYFCSWYLLTCALSSSIFRFKVPFIWFRPHWEHVYRKIRRFFFGHQNCFYIEWMLGA